MKFVTSALLASSLAVVGHGAFVTSAGASTPAAYSITSCQWNSTTNLTISLGPSSDPVSASMTSTGGGGFYYFEFFESWNPDPFDPTSPTYNGVNFDSSATFEYNAAGADSTFILNYYSVDEINQKVGPMLCSITVSYGANEDPPSSGKNFGKSGRDKSVDPKDRERDYFSTPPGRDR